MDTEKRRGRPRKGKGSLPTSEMPRLTALFEPLLLDQMRALAQIRDVPVYQLINDGCHLLWDELSETEREQVEKLRAWKLGGAEGSNGESCGKEGKEPTESREAQASSHNAPSSVAGEPA